MKIYRIAAASMGWILGTGEIIDAMSGHEEAVLANPDKFGYPKYIMDAYYVAFKSGAVRYSKALSRNEISFEGTKQSISKNIDVIHKLSGSRTIHVDFYDLSIKSIRSSGMFDNISDLYMSL
jgi:hypothetical protein